LVKADSVHHQFQSTFLKQSRIIFLQNAIYNNKLEYHVKISELKYNDFKNKEIIENQNIRLKNNQLLFLLIALFITASIIITILILINRNKRIVNLLNTQLLKENEIKLKNEKLYQHQLNEENQQLINQQKEIEIKLKENELINLANQFEISNEILEHIYNELKIDVYKKNNDITDYKKKINNLIGFISQKQKEIKSPELFNTKFNQVHPEFFGYLKQKHPILSVHDLKLCAYIKINMSNKQIATILNITHDGLLKARYRLRKKMLLDKSVSLEQYLNKIV
jgi:DNA-binding CsgD family transcriptional regulator